MSTWLKREWSQLFAGATGVSAPKSVPFPFTIFARTSRYVLARSRYASPVPCKMNSIWATRVERCQLLVFYPTTSILVYVGCTANKSSSLLTFVHDCRYTNAVLGEYVRSLSLSFGGLVRRRAAVRFIRFVDGAVRCIRLPGGGVLREDCSSGLFRLL